MNKKEKGILIGFIPFVVYIVGFSTLIIKELNKQRKENL